MMSGVGDPPGCHSDNLRCGITRAHEHEHDTLPPPPDPPEATENTFSLKQDPSSSSGSTSTVVDDSSSRGSGNSSDDSSDNSSDADDWDSADKIDGGGGGGEGANAISGAGIPSAFIVDGDGGGLEGVNTVDVAEGAPPTPDRKKISVLNCLLGTFGCFIHPITKRITKKGENEALAASRKKPRRVSDGHILSANDLRHQQQQRARLVDASPSSDQTSKKYWQDKYYQLSREAAQAFLAQATQQGLTRRRGGNTWCILNQYQPGEDLPPHWYNFESDRVYEDSLRFNSAQALLELAEDEGQEVAGLSAKVFDDNTVQILLVYHFLPSDQNLGKVGGALGSDGNKLSKNYTAYHTILAMAISLSSTYGYDMKMAVVLVYQMVGWVDVLQLSGDHDMADKQKKTKKKEYDRLWKLAHEKSIAFCGESVKKFKNLRVIIPIGDVAYKVVKQYPEIFPQDKLLPIQDRSLAHPSSFVLSKGATDEQSELWFDVLNHAFAACMGIKPTEDLPSWLPGALFYQMIKETKEKRSKSMKKTLADKKARGDMSTVNAARLAGTVGKWDAMIQRAKDGAEGEILYHAKCDKDGCTNQEGRPIKFHLKAKTSKKKKYYYPRLYSKCNCHTNQHEYWLPLFKLPHGKEEVWDGYKLELLSNSANSTRLVRIYEMYVN